MGTDALIGKQQGRQRQSGFTSGRVCEASGWKYSVLIVHYGRKHPVTELRSVPSMSWYAGSANTAGSLT